MQAGPRRIAAAIATTALILAACNSQGAATSGPTAPATQAAVATVVPATAAPPTGPVATPEPICINRESEWCLNVVPAGTYSSRIFQPKVTWTVPAGWANYEDVPGHYLLVPPGGDFAGVNGDTSDFVGVYEPIAVPDGCADRPKPGVGLKPADLKNALESNPGLTVTSEDVTFSGRAGYLLEIRMKATWTSMCEWSRGKPAVNLIVGFDDSEGMDHVIFAGSVTLLYLLSDKKGASTLAIEVVDIGDDGGVTTSDAVVQTLRFAPDS